MRIENLKKNTGVHAHRAARCHRLFGGDAAVGTGAGKGTGSANDEFRISNSEFNIRNSNALEPVHPTDF